MGCGSSSLAPQPDEGRPVPPGAQPQAAKLPLELPASSSAAETVPRASSSTGSRGDTAEKQPGEPPPEEQRQRRTRVLVLGAGDVGKTTLLRQMQLLFQSSHYAEDNRSVFVGTIRACLLEIVRDIVCGMRRLEIDFDEADTIECAIRLREAAMEPAAHAAGSERHVADIVRLRADGGVRRALERSLELHLAESSRYFLEAAERLFAPDYQPNDIDLLRLRVRSTGVTRFQVESFHCVLSAPLRAVNDCRCTADCADCAHSTPLTACRSTLTRCL